MTPDVIIGAEKHASISKQSAQRIQNANFTFINIEILVSFGVFVQLSGLFTSLVVLIVLLLIGPLFYFLPKVSLNMCLNNL